MNKNLLKSILAANGDNYSVLAEYLGITTSTLSNKVNEKHKAGFTQPEIIMIKNRYSLSADDVDAVFFTKQVS